MLQETFMDCHSKISALQVELKRIAESMKCRKLLEGIPDEDLPLTRPVFKQIVQRAAMCDQKVTGTSFRQTTKDGMEEVVEISSGYEQEIDGTHQENVNHKNNVKMKQPQFPPTIMGDGQRVSRVRCPVVRFESPSGR